MGLDRPEGETGRGRDLLVRLALPNGEVEDAPLLWPQLFERALSDRRRFANERRVRVELLL